jgi:hypothetical protein
MMRRNPLMDRTATKQIAKGVCLAMVLQRYVVLVG